MKAKAKIFFFSLACLIHSTHAQLCTPAMSAEQAYLSLNHPIQTSSVVSSTRSNLPKLININTASEAELTQLDGIGAKKAQDIILYREMIAPFASVDDLDKVKGIGKATVDKNRARISVR